MSIPVAVGQVLDAYVPDLVQAGAEAVVLTGSYARGAATAHSDVDLYVLSPARNGSAITRRLGYLVTVTWTNETEVAASFVSLPKCTLAVPAWRIANVIRDPAGVAANLQQVAKDWTWEAALSGQDLDAWCQAELEGFAEEVQKVRGAIAAGDVMSAVIWRNVLATKLAPIFAVHLRLLLDREEETWPAVSDRLGEPWATAQRQALALGGETLEESCAAAIRLWELACAQLRVRS